MDDQYEISGCLLSLHEWDCGPIGDKNALLHVWVKQCTGSPYFFILSLENLNIWGFFASSSLLSRVVFRGWYSRSREFLSLIFSFWEMCIDADGNSVMASKIFHNAILVAVICASEFATGSTVPAVPGGKLSCLVNKCKTKVISIDSLQQSLLGIHTF